MARGRARRDEGVQLWDVVELHQLYVLPPARKGEDWMARTCGGAHDPDPLYGYGKTPAAAVEACVRLWEERQRTARILG
jgi:hypothetical protein